MGKLILQWAGQGALMGWMGQSHWEVTAGHGDLGGEKAVNREEILQGSCGREERAFSCRRLPWPVCLHIEHLCPPGWAPRSSAPVFILKYLLTLSFPSYEILTPTQVLKPGVEKCLDHP